LKVSLVPHEKSQGTAPRFDDLGHSWLGAVELAIAIGIAYFLAARLGLSLRVQVGVVIFWPAAGIAVGALIALGPKARLPVVAAVIISMTASILMVGRSPWLAIALGLSTAGEALLTAWLIERWFNGVFKLEDVPQVLGFLAASVVSAAIGTAGAATVIRFVEPTTFPPDVWWLWFASASLGIITVAPLLIGLGQAVRKLPPRREVIEGAAGLALLAGLSKLFVSQTPGSWSTALPVLFAVPILLWIAVRCRPVFAAAAMFVVTLAVALSTTFNLDHLGDASTPVVDRIRTAQTLVLAGALLTLVLAALFSERRRSEAALAKSKERLLLALDGAELGTFSADLITGRLECDARAAQFHGHNAAPRTIKESRRFVRADDLVRVDAALAEAKRIGNRWNAEYRVVPPPDHANAGETRWVAVESSIVRNPLGIPVGLLGVTRDITERKRAEQDLADLNVQRELAGSAGLVGSYAYDTDGDTGVEKAKISPGYAAIHGLPEGTSEITRKAWLARVHPEDVERLQVIRNQAFHQRRQEYSVDYRIVRASEVRWIESRTFISYSGDGHPQRVIGVNIDVTERKRTEALLGESKDRLSDAMVAGQVMAFEWDAISGLSQRSDNAANMLGCDQGGKTTSARNDFVKRVHPDDRASLKTHLRDLRPDDASYALSFRYIRPDGRQVWLEETARGEFDAAGRLLRIKGLTRDITERKNAELALAERNVQLALAAKAGLVGSYSYDPDTDRLQISEGYAAIHGLPEGTKVSTRTAWQSRALPEDRDRINALRMEAFRERRGEYGAEYRIVRAGEVRWIESRSFISYASDGCPQRVIGVNIDVTERKRAEERQGILVAELDHRVKNVLATVSAIITQTQEASSSHVDFVTALNRRINSLARTHELLSESNWRGASLAEIVRREFAPYATGNAEAGGPSVTLKAEATQAVATVLHELTTNAAKYGAFSSRAGHVSVQWRWLQNGSRDRLVIEWQETGGPPVLAPTQSGYGTSIIRELIPFELGGKVELVYACEGIRCQLEIPADWISIGGGLAQEPDALGETI
jgi:PAS domain S-box-containing protein